jgi:hypothetical protein
VSLRVNNKFESLQQSFRFTTRCRARRYKRTTIPILDTYMCFRGICR